jgi:NAD+ synthase (glutamine-hydrolysing)
MRKKLKLAGAALNQTPLDWENNLKNIYEAIGEAKANKADLLLLPELSITGYNCEDLFLSEWLSQTAFDKLLQLKEWCDEGLVVCVGLPVRLENKVYNTACVIKDQKILGFTAKQFMAKDGVHYEPRWFEPWPPNMIQQFQMYGHLYSIGDIIYEEQGVKFAFEICEDAWVLNRPASRHAMKGVQLMLNPSASHFALSKTETRHILVMEASKRYNCAYLYTNLLGNEAGRMIYDGEILIVQKGCLVERNELLSFKNVDLLAAEVTFDEEDAGPAEIERLPPVNENQELTAAVSLALFDYMRKSRTNGFVLSLSGGADSSACAVFVSEMVRRGVAELGLEAFIRKTRCLPPEAAAVLTELSEQEQTQALTGRLLTCAYQASVNSSQDTYQSAEGLARSIGAGFHAWTIDDEVEGYTNKIEAALRRELTWEQDDLTLQNIQARVRAPAIWMMANIRNALLMATSNRSEASVGYATMDGDTAGSISPIAGIDKDFLRQWLVWAQQELGYEGLRFVNGLQPTAELRPVSENQTDEKDLMPYAVLNEIERLGFYERLSPRQVLERMRPEYEEEELKAWIRRFFTLWSRNQWKRERYAPAFHLDDYNVDPRSWLRFPILSGGYVEELREL